MCPLHGVSKLPFLYPTSLNLPNASDSVAYRNPIYHETIFACIILAVVARTTYMFQRSDRVMAIPTKTKDSIVNCFNAGLAMFLFGFFVWNVDNIFCQTLTRWKILIGWPAAFFLEGMSTLSPRRSVSR